MSRLDLSNGYGVEVSELDEGFYWHLFYLQTRVNGGLSDTWVNAYRSARRASACHMKDELSGPVFAYGFDSTL